MAVAGLCLQQVQGFLFFPCYTRNNKLEAKKRVWEGEQEPGQLTHNDQGDHIQRTQCEGKKWGGFDLQAAVVQRLSRLYSAFGRCQMLSIPLVTFILFLSLIVLCLNQ